MRGSFAVLPTSASSERLMPGAMIDRLELGRSAEIDDDQVATVFLMRCEDIEGTVRAQRTGLIDIDRKGPGRITLPSDDRRLAEILLRKHCEVVIGARHDRSENELSDIFAREAFDLQELEQPDRIFIARPARIGGNTPARAYLATFEQGEDDICVSDIGGEQHGDLFL